MQQNKKLKRELQVRDRPIRKQRHSYMDQKQKENGGEIYDRGEIK